MTTRRKPDDPGSLEPQCRYTDAEGREKLTYGALFAAMASREIAIRLGLKAAGEAETELGAFTPAEIRDANEWADAVIHRAAR